MCDDDEEENETSTTTATTAANKEKREENEQLQLKMKILKSKLDQQKKVRMPFAFLVEIFNTPGVAGTQFLHLFWPYVAFVSTFFYTVAIE